MSKEEIEHLQWVHDRIINVYGESENVDFLIRMRKILNQNKEDEKLSMSSPCKDFSFTVPFEQSNVITDVKITMNTKNGVCKELNIPIEWDNINQNKDD